MSDGTVAIVCGPKPYIDTLECGHTVTAHGGKREKRRCPECDAGTVPEGRPL
jgi:hypothetical protein